MQLRINFKSGQAIHLQIIDQVKAAAASGALRAGEGLPSVTTLAADLRVNRNSIAKAYAELEDMGLIDTIPDKGSFLRDSQTPLRKEGRRKLLMAEIDKTIVQAPQAVQKTLMYSLLTAVLAVVYLGLVLGVGVLIVRAGVVRGETVTVLSTVVLFALFMPLRNRVQSFVDRVVFAKRYEFLRTLESIKSERVAQPDLDSFMTRVVEMTGAALHGDVAVVRDYSEMLSMVDAHPSLRSSRAPVPSSGSLLVPVISDDEFVAVLKFTRSGPNKLFDNEDSQFLNAVAEQAAIAANHFRLRREKQETEYALEIQRGLLPREIPQLPGFSIAGAWQPARTVGGDYYDVFKLDELKIALVMADVSGKGIPAAILMANLQATVKAYATPDCAPKDLCQKVNRAVANSITTGKFITFVFAILDSAACSLTYTNAGHSPPLLVRRDGSCLSLGAGGTVLGLFADWSYDQATIDLRVGDRLAIFTDGVTEATNSDGEDYGDDRLIEILKTHPPAHATGLRETIMRNVAQFCREDFNDDATLLTVVVHSGSDV